MPATTPPTDPKQQAKFVFQGTVQKMKAANLKEVAAADDIAIVRVDKILHAPEPLRGFAGEEITVQVAPDQPVKAGQTYIFYTNGWIFGANLAVRSVAQEAATATGVAALQSHPQDPVRSLKTREALAQAAAADLIVTGRVSAVRLPAGESQARATAMASGRTSERISEHAPVWQEAVIDVDAVHKGGAKPKQVVVRFPSSTDVRWYKAPKFHAGQEGVFLLHKEQLAGGPAALAAASIGPGEYTALDPADVQPLEELPRIKLAVGGGGS
jgi:hypothetical protein